jgi:hypothetical protein
MLNSLLPQSEIRFKMQINFREIIFGYKFMGKKLFVSRFVEGIKFMFLPCGL